MKKTTVIAVTGAMVLGVGLLFPTLVSADENGDTFIQRFAERFNISEDEVEGVVQEMREEHREERQEEREDIVSSALDDGSLTEKQGEILSVMAQVRDQERESEDFVPGEGMRNREERHEEMVNTLNDEGLDVTQEELDDLREIVKGLGLGVGEGKGMGNGGGMRMGRE